MQERIGAPLSRFVGSKQLATFFLIILVLAILLVHSWHIVHAAWFGYFDYDLGKAVGDIERSQGLADYVKRLGFGQGIAMQFYLIAHVLEPTPATFKLLSYLFLLLGLLVVLYLNTSSEAGNGRLIYLPVLASTVFIFLNSPVIKYLGSYGMLSYCQGIFFGALLLYFSYRHLWANEFPERRTIAIWCLILLLATFSDIRFSFYACAAFSVALLRNFGNRSVFLRYFNFGVLAGIIVLLPICSQLVLKGDLFTSYKPFHVLPLLYSGDYSFAAIFRFLVDRVVELFTSFLYSDSQAAVSIYFIFAGAGLYKLFQSSPGRCTLAFLLICLVVQAVASIFAVYPFGRIRYCLPLFPVFIFVFWQGISLILDQFYRFRRADWVIASLSIVTIWLSIDWSWPEITKHMSVQQRLYARQQVLVDRLREMRGSVWCDLATEKIALAYQVPCSVIATWNFLSQKEEDPEFLEEVSKGISGAGGDIIIFLFRHIEGDFYSPIREMLDSNGYSQVESLHGHGTHAYVYSKSAV